MNRHIDRYFKKLRKRFLKDEPDFDFSVEGNLAGLNDIVVDMADRLMAETAHKTGLSENTLRSRLVKVGMVDLEGVNGYTRTSDGWKTFEIGINMGLMIFFHKMIKVFASRMSVLDESGRPSSKYKIPALDTASAARRLMRAFWEGDLTSTHGFRLADLADHQVEISQSFLDYAEWFVVAHEMAHIVINLTREKPANQLDDIVSWVRSSLRDVAGAAEIALLWGEEIYADYIGFGLQVSSIPKNHSFERIMAFSSAQLVLIMQMMLEDFHKTYYGQDAPISEHPPSLFRLESLRALVRRGNPPELMEMGEGLEQLANAILAGK
jgi:hypothetical protein